MAFLLQDWVSGGHEVPLGLAFWFTNAALTVLLAGYAALFVRAFLRRRWYRARGVLSDSDLAALKEAVAVAERRTIGEILPVIVERSDPHPGATWLAACMTLLVGTTALLPRLPWDHPELLLLTQLALGALGFGCARLLPGFKRFFVRESRASEVAEEQAFQEFHRHGLFRTEARTGVLLFVSLFEQRAIVLADEGIHARVGPEQWQSTNQTVLAGIRAGSLRDGLLAGIRSVGEVLTREFPYTDGDRNEVPDRVIVRQS